MKTYRQLERIVKGFANHRRVSMLELLSKEPDLSVQDIGMKLKTNGKTTSEHLRRLTFAGLIMKRNRGNNVLHKLTVRGDIILKFLRKLE